MTYNDIRNIFAERIDLCHKFYISTPLDNLMSGNGRYDGYTKRQWTDTITHKELVWLAHMGWKCEETK